MNSQVSCLQRKESRFYRVFRIEYRIMETLFLFRKNLKAFFSNFIEGKQSWKLSAAVASFGKETFEKKEREALNLICPVTFRALQQGRDLQMKAADL